MLRISAELTSQFAGYHKQQRTRFALFVLSGNYAVLLATVNQFDVLIAIIIIIIIIIIIVIIILLLIIIIIIIRI